MKILEEIKKEHDEVRDLMLQLENDEEQAAEIFSEMAATILAHHEAEEEVVFEKLPDEKEAQDLKMELISEHDSLRRAIQAVLDTDPDDDYWMPRYKVMKEIFWHHIQEEEGELFEKLRDALSDKQLEKLYEPFESTEEKKKEEMKKKVDSKMVLKPEKDLPDACMDAMDAKDAEGKSGKSKKK